MLFIGFSSHGIFTCSFHHLLDFRNRVSLKCKYKVHCRIQVRLGSRLGLLAHSDALHWLRREIA